MLCFICDVFFVPVAQKSVQDITWLSPVQQLLFAFGYYADQFESVMTEFFLIPF